MAAELAIDGLSMLDAHVFVLLKYFWSTSAVVEAV